MIKNKTYRETNVKKLIKNKTYREINVKTLMFNNVRIDRQIVRNELKNFINFKINNVNNDNEKSLLEKLDYEINVVCIYDGVVSVNLLNNENCHTLSAFVHLRKEATHGINVFDKLVNIAKIKKIPFLLFPIHNFTESTLEINNSLFKLCSMNQKNSFQTYLRNNTTNRCNVVLSERVIKNDTIVDIPNEYHIWKVILFQVFFTLANIQEIYPTFRSNHFMAHNICVAETRKNIGSAHHILGNISFKIPNIGMEIRVDSFSYLADIPGVYENENIGNWCAISGISHTQNMYTDVHFFVNSLICQKSNIPGNILTMLHKIVPPKYRGLESVGIIKRYRLLVNDEYTTPKKILEEFYSDFIVKTNSEIEASFRDIYFIF